MKLLTRDDLKNRGIRYTNVHLARLERAGRFPRRVRLGGGRSLTWLETEIDGYIESAVNRRDVPAPKNETPSA